MTFVDSVPPAEAVKALRKRLTALTALQALAERKYERLKEVAGEHAGEYYWALVSLSRDMKHRDVEIAWTRRIIRMLSAPKVESGVKGPDRVRKPVPLDDA